MKFAVFCALAATANAAALAAGCATDDAARLAGGKANADCNCPTNCTVCKGAAGAAGTPTAVPATDCFVCAANFTVKKANAADKFGTCTAAASGGAAGGSGTAGKGVAGATCDGDGENAGCADGLRCGKA